MRYRNIFRVGVVALCVLGSQAGCVLVGYDFGGYRLEAGDASVGDAGHGSPDGADCVPRTCEELLAECGKVPDGCGGVLECGACEVGICGGGGRNRCGVDPCTPRGCEELGAACGEISDGCGDTVQCGRCAAPETCGGGGTSKKCGCLPVTCPDVGAECGVIDDDCPPSAAGVVPIGAVPCRVSRRLVGTSASNVDRLPTGAARSSIAATRAKHRQPAAEVERRASAAASRRLVRCRGKIAAPSPTGAVGRSTAARPAQRPPPARALECPTYAGAAPKAARSSERSAGSSTTAAGPSSIAENAQPPRLAPPTGHRTNANASRPPARPEAPTAARFPTDAAKP